MDKTIACDISVARDELGYEPTVELYEGMRRSIRWCVAAGTRAVTTTSLVTGGSGYFGSLARRRARRRRRTTCGCSTSTSPTPTTSARRGRSPATSATAPVVRAAVDGVDVVFHNVAQVPLAKDHDAAAHGQRRRHGAAARRLPPTPASARSCTRRRARCSACPRRTRCCRRRCRRRPRPTATPSSPPSGPACAQPPTGST